MVPQCNHADPSSARSRISATAARGLGRCGSWCGDGAERGFRQAGPYSSGPAQPVLYAFGDLSDYINNDINYQVAFKPVTFHGDSLDRLRDFPEDARRQAGHELYQVQKGLDPSDWKPMPTIGPGVREIRIRDAVGVYRVIYLAAMADAIHVLHAFQKKSRKTAQRDLDVAAARLRQLKRGWQR
jgi:phage-related protein